MHLADLADFDEFNRAYAEFFTALYPVRTTVGSQLMGILVEIDVVAAIPRADLASQGWYNAAAAASA